MENECKFSIFPRDGKEFTGNLNRIYTSVVWGFINTTKTFSIPKQGGLDLNGDPEQHIDQCLREQSI